MRILMVTHYYSSHGGGIELVAHRLSSELVKFGHQVEWAATDTKEGLPENIKCVPMSGVNMVERFSGMPYPLWGLRGYRRLFASIRAADIVHVHEGIYMSSQVCVRLARFMKKRVVLTQHVGSVPTKRRWLRTLIHLGNARLTCRVLRTADAVVFVSRVVRDFFQSQTCPSKTFLIANGTDSDLFHESLESRQNLRTRLGLHPDRGLVLFVGRFVEKKGLPYIRRLAERFQSVQWVFAGRGPEDPSAWKLGNVKILGKLHHQELICWYQCADLLLLPSIGEGFPLVVQEAMACGLPCAIFRETWAAWGQGEENFIILDDHSLDRDLGTILLKNRDRGLRSRVAGYAAQSWHWSNTVREYERVYQNILNGR
jgi:glycosyltransferase involved in cell wall biosynthesis